MGLTPDQKPVFDLLVRDNLTKEEIRQIKAASVGLLKAIKAKIEEVQGIFQKQSTRDGLKRDIYDFLYEEKTGLPPSKYEDAVLEEKTDVLFQFFENRYSRVIGHSAFA